KSGVVTGNVPREGGTYFFFTRFPAMASMGMIIKNRPASMVRPIVTSYHSVFTVSPPKADPLFAVPDTYAYNISLRPCGPGFAIPDVPNPFTLDTAVKTRIIRGKTRTTSIAIFTS